LTISKDRKAVIAKCGVTVMSEQRATETKWNPEMRRTIENLRQALRPGETVTIEGAPHNLVIIKRDRGYTVCNNKKVIVDCCESVKVLDNGWMVVFMHGRYHLIYKDGQEYKGLLFLKKRNVINFAKTL